VVGDEFGDRLAGFGQDDLITLEDLLDEAGELGFGLGDILDDRGLLLHGLAWSG
jgi:hypothetical protein